MLLGIMIAAGGVVLLYYAAVGGGRFLYLEGQRSDAYKELERVVHGIETWNPDTFRMALDCVSGVEEEDESALFAAYSAASETTSGLDVELRGVRIELPDPSSHAVARLEWRYSALLGSATDGSPPSSSKTRSTSPWRSAVVTMKRTDEDDPFDFKTIETTIPEIERAPLGP